MLDRMQDYFEEIDDSIIVKAPYIEVYLPKNYFDTNIAVQYANVIETFGIFNFIIYKDINNDKDMLIKTLEIPTRIRTKPSSIENLKSANKEDELLMILKYYKDDVFIENLNVNKTVENVMSLYKLFTSGKLSSSIKYNRILNLILDNCRLNNFNYGVSSLVIELVISEICRNQNNLSEQFRFALNKNKKLELDSYQPINIKRIPQFESTFTAITFEDFQTAVTLGINKARSKGKEAVSPIEKTIKY